MLKIDRGIREVCNEALYLLKEEHEPGEYICTEEIAGYFTEILSILDETEDDRK